MKTNRKKNSNERTRRCFYNCIINIQDDFPSSFLRVYYSFRHGNRTNIYKLKKNTERDSFINFIGYDQTSTWRLQKIADYVEDKITKGDIKKYSKLESKLIPIFNISLDAYGNSQYTGAEISALKRTCSNELERISKLVWKFQGYIDDKCEEIYEKFHMPKDFSCEQMKRDVIRIRKIILAILELKSHANGMYCIQCFESSPVSNKKTIMSEILYTDYPREPRNKNNEVDYSDFMEKYIFPSRLASNEDSENTNPCLVKMDVKKDVNYIYGLKYTMSDKLAEKIENIFDIRNLSVKKTYLFIGMTRYNNGKYYYPVVSDDLVSIVPMENMVLSRIVNEIHGCNIDYDSLIDLRNQIGSDLSVDTVVTMDLHATSTKDVLDEHMVNESFICQTSNLAFFRQMQKRSYDHFKKIMDGIHLTFISSNSPKDESSDS